jgi:hypothetical protein
MSETDEQEKLATKSRLWLVVSGLCLLAAAVLLIVGFADGSFVVGVVGVLAWFVNLRAQIR